MAGGEANRLKGEKDEREEKSGRIKNNIPLHVYTPALSQNERGKYADPG